MFNLCMFQSITILNNYEIFTKSLELLSSQQSMRIVFNTLEGSYALCLLANLIQLAYFERNNTLPGLSFPTFTVSLPKSDAPKAKLARYFPRLY